MKDLAEAKRILGMKIERDRVKERVSLTQKTYLQKVLQRFLIDDEAKSVSNMLAPYIKLSVRKSPKIVNDCENMSHVLYTSAVNSLMYGVNEVRFVTGCERGIKIHA